MTESRYGSCLLIAADGAGLSFHAGFCTGRLSGDNVFTVGVTESGNFFLCGQYFAADRAVTALGESGFGTSSVNCGVSDRCVTESCNGSCLLITADGAGLSFHAGFCAGRLSGDSVFTVGVTESGNNLLCYKHFTADGAVTTLSKSRFGAGGGNCGVSDFRMTESRNNIILICISASRASVSSVTVFCAGRERYFR